MVKNMCFFLGLWIWNQKFFCKLNVFTQETKIITFSLLLVLSHSSESYYICNLYMGDDVQLILFHEHFIDIEYSFLVHGFLQGLP